MTQDDLYRIFEKSGAILSGHFLLSSGLHSPHYVQCARLFEDPGLAEPTARELASLFQGEKVEWVVGPALGGILLAYELARIMKARAAFTERVEGRMALRRGFSIPPRSLVLVAEDVLTTGGSALEAARCLEAMNAKVMGIAALVDRAGAILPYPVKTLLSLKLEAIRPEECSLCARAIPVIKPGSRA